MHPALEEPIFARWYAGDAVRGASKIFLGCHDNELQMGGFSSPPESIPLQYLNVFFPPVIQNCSISL